MLAIVLPVGHVANTSESQVELVKGPVHHQRLGFVTEPSQLSLSSYCPTVRQSLYITSGGIVDEIDVAEEPFQQLQREACRIFMERQWLLQNDPVPNPCQKW